MHSGRGSLPLWLHIMEIATPMSIASTPSNFPCQFPFLCCTPRSDYCNYGPRPLLLRTAEGQTFSETVSGHGLRSSSSSVWSISTSHVTVRAAEGDDALAVQKEEGEGEGEEKGSARSLQSLGLVSEADLLRKKAKKARLSRKRLVRKRRLRKKGCWPPSKLATNKNTWQLREEGKLLDMVDPMLKEYPEEEVAQFIKVALLCTQAAANFRPSMSQVVAMLSKEININEKLLSRPGFISDFKNLKTRGKTHKLPSRTNPHGHQMSHLTALRKGAASSSSSSSMTVTTTSIFSSSPVSFTQMEPR